MIDSYLNIWSWAFSNILIGAGAKTLATITLVLSFWFGVRRQNIQLALILFLFTLVLAYGGFIVKIGKSVI